MHRVRIYQGDITALNVDVIVNAASADLSEGIGVSASIRGAAGAEYALSCRALGSCPVGEIRVTPGFRLAANMVIHAVGPVWRGGDNNEAGLLASCYYKAMIAAKKHSASSIAFPAISCGAAGFPVHGATKVAIDQVKSALQDNALIESVVFCCFDPVTAAVYKNQIGK
jgi:O-acetyl-ADP-ribose deacetylase (regulator of RNase III)